MYEHCPSKSVVPKKLPNLTSISLHLEGNSISDSDIAFEYEV